VKKTTFALAALAAFTAAPALHAQSGFALKGSYVFNSSKVNDARQSGFSSVPSPDGFSVGAEYVLPIGIGVGASAYAEGSATDVNTKSTNFTAIVEANYFAKLPMIPVRPYAGIHAGLGRYTIQNVTSGGATSPRVEDNRSEFGYQAGVRLQLTPMFGVDGQYRHMSDSASKEQSPSLERNQFMLGVTLF
jgi:opacity protein-like surface antigen